MTDRTSLRIDSDRLWQSLMEMAEISATLGGGNDRQALTDGDDRARRLFRSWCEAAGIEVRVDEVGNMFARREGRDNSLPPILAGSHLDTQPTGGRFDGPVGVLSALEVVRTLNDAGVETRGPIEIVNWTNEEGARFAPPMMGSGAWAGVFSVEETRLRSDLRGVTVGAELDRLGWAGGVPAKAHDLRASFEIHIEQGPILEAEGKEIGVVTGVQGMRWLDLSILGAAAHAGTTPMDRRRDPMQTLSAALTRLFEEAPRVDADLRFTVGRVLADPGVQNTVPWRVEATIDLRHPDDAVLDAFEARIREILDEEAQARDTPAELDRIWSASALRFAERCVSAVRTAAESLGIGHRDMISGAGHDSVYVAGVAPAGMIFIPCRDGVSHNEAEWAEPRWVAAGANVLLHALLDVDARIDR